MNRTPRLLVAVLVALVGLALAGCGAAAPAPTPGVSPSPSVAATPSPAAGVAPASPPATLRIPAIGVDSPVNPVGLNPDGTLEVPAPGPLYDQAAWYRASPTPGASGPSVLLGHVDSAADGPSVFYRLGELAPGDRVEVTLADRTSASFVVDTVSTFPKDAFPQRLVYGTVPRAELRLITCGGSFDPSARSYRDNVVVFAHRV